MTRNRRQTKANRRNNKEQDFSYTGPKSPAKIRPGAEIQPKPIQPETKPDNKPESKPETKPEPPKSKN